MQRITMTINELKTDDDSKQVVISAVGQRDEEYVRSYVTFTQLKPATVSLGDQITVTIEYNA